MQKQCGPETIDLRTTLVDSAQCFHWIEHDGRFGALVHGNAVWLWQDEDGGVCADCDDWMGMRKYLDLDRDYDLALSPYLQYEQCRRAIRSFGGLRILNQDPWEALVAFLLSANNNVSRIRRLVTAINRAYGSEIDAGGVTLYGFPEAKVLANTEEEALRKLGVGYRAPYLVETARRVADGFPLWDLWEMPYDEAHRLLISLPGVGDKVADCVLLFGCEHAEAFPVDVWVERLMNAWFDLREKNRTRLAQRSRELLGNNAGLLQQYLFHAARTGAIELTI